MAKVAEKSLYRGVFNFNRTVLIEYAYAYSQEQARVVMCRRLAKKRDVHPAVVLSKFSGKQGNFEIGIEMEVIEDE